MRVLLDANIYISYLIAPHLHSVTAPIIEAAFLEVYTLLLPQEVTDEVVQKLITKAYLGERVTIAEATSFFQSLQLVGEIIPTVSIIPQIVRDKKDDYMIAYALAGGADYIVSGDKDLTDMHHIEQTRIVTPAVFVSLLASGKRNTV